MKLLAQPNKNRFLRFGYSGQRDQAIIDKDQASML
jgi:hypothetical protein